MPLEVLSPGEPTGKLLWGIVGAVAPEVLRLNRIVTGASRDSLPTFSYPYFLISLANALP
ncbi:MAG TPA: hypothetical protein VGM22_10765 [Methylomirabilota bacterium]